MLKPLTQQTDEELMAEFQKGNEAAFDLLVARYKDPLTNFAYRMVGDEEECHDIVQDALVRLFRRKATYRPPGRFSTWMYAITLNLARSRLRSRSLRRFVSINRPPRAVPPEYDLPDKSARPDEAIDAVLKGERIQEALDALPAKLREAVVMRDVQDLSYEEISEISGVPIGTVKSRISRGREQLQGMLNDLLKE